MTRHSSPSLTMTVYRQLIPGTQTDAARLFCEALQGLPSREADESMIPSDAR